VIPEEMDSRIMKHSNGRIQLRDNSQVMVDEKGGIIVSERKGGKYERKLAQTNITASI
tara:strand:+ start:412 stop:585 length:174 start_codon:yes stop_codon:yes gene_type:complete